MTISIIKKILDRDLGYVDICNDIKINLKKSSVRLSNNNTIDLIDRDLLDTSYIISKDNDKFYVKVFMEDENLSVLLITLYFIDDEGISRILNLRTEYRDGFYVSRFSVEEVLDLEFNKIYFRK